MNRVDQDSPKRAEVPGKGATVALLLVCGLLVSACSGYRSYRNAQVAETEGDWDQAVLEYMELVSRNPKDLRYRTALVRAKSAASHEHFDKAKEQLDAGLLRQAMIELQKAVQLDPTNQYAQAELRKVREQIEAQRRGESRETLAEIKSRTSGSTGLPPVLNPRSNEPIDLDFPEPVSIQKIYQALGKAFGINVLFDPKLRDQEVSITLREVTAQDALEILMRTAGHFYKVLDEHSIIVVADTPQNRRNYEDLIIQTFFLSNSDVKDVMAMLRSLVDSRKIASNEKLNAIILRDTADKVKIAERIIQQNDKAKAEVVVDVELIELSTNALRDLGLSMSQYSVGWSVNTGGEDSSLRFSDLEFLNENDWSVTIPGFVFDFLREQTEAQTLAKPQLRISEGERARLRIGDRVPVPVTSFNTANTVGSNVVPITSFQYQDVGIIIEVEPRVHHNEEISLSISVEVSNIAGNIDNQPIIGTRNIETTIRLKDGETNFLAGLLRQDDTESENGVPGLSEIPLLGRLFSSKRTQAQRSDIVLTLTPHIVRRADITEEDLTPIWVGTEANLTFSGGSPRIESDVQGPFDDEPRGEVDDAQERMRRRLQQLPRGLRNGQENEQEEQQAPPSGTDLVPQSPRSSPFDRDDDDDESDGEPPRMMSDLGPVDDGGIAFALGPGWVQGFAEENGAELASVWEAGPQEQENEKGEQKTRREGDLAERELTRPQADRQSVAGQALEPRPEDGIFDPPGPIDPPPVPPNPGQDITLNLVSQAQAITVGDEVTVELRVNARSPLSHVPFTLEYDPRRLEPLEVSDGGFFGASNEVLFDTSRPGRVLVGASRLGDVPGVAGSGAIVTLRFRTLAPGPTELGLSELKVLDETLAEYQGVSVAPLALEIGGVEPKTPKSRSRGQVGALLPGSSAENQPTADRALR